MKSIRYLYLGSNVLDAFSGRTAGLITQFIVVNQLGFEGRQLAVLNSLSIVLYLLAAVPIGRLVDSLPPLRVLIGSLAVKALLLSALAALYVAGGLSFWTILILQVMQSFVGMFIDNSQVITAVKIQEATPGPKLVARLEAADSAVGIAAPGVVSLLAAGEFYREGYLGAAALGICAAMLIAGPVRLRLAGTPGFVASAETAQSEAAQPDSAQPEPAQSEGEVRAGSFLDGFRLIIADRQVLLPVLLIAAGNLGLAFSDTPQTLFLLRETALDPSAYASLKMFGAGAGLVASLITPRIIDRFSFFRLVVVATLGQLVATLFFLAAVLLRSQVYYLAAASSVVWTMAVVLINVAAMDYLVSALPKGKIGIGLASMRIVCMGAVPVGAMLGGYIVDYVGYTFSAGLWTGMALATFVLGISLGRRQT
ncbi:MFS transporter [Corynebacterium lizhenjunii]|uniref:MFS transporter n=1 Tax=Corynebacterium lizhenjunii TaxID=2709394 RepID=A0A7T0PAR1_9CORY|nr:MFS transporter [Corynebacterium lizhenjunii]QPK79351.1 MFS transporter [Corynebacterium lizhenjunii]